MMKRTFAALAVLILAGCAQVPPEAVELSNTVGRDITEMRRAHLALVDLHFDKSKAAINRFVDETYAPAFIAEFAKEADLVEKVKLSIATVPDELLDGLTVFVRIAHDRIERKRGELLDPVLEQQRQVTEEVNAAYEQILTAQAIVSGHLASVRKVYEVQNQLIAKTGLTDLREKIGATTARVSDKVGDLVATGEKIDAKIDEIDKHRRDLGERILSAQEKAKMRLDAINEKAQGWRDAIGG
jgi:uncharacterized lipoprotein YajG